MDSNAANRMDAPAPVIEPKRNGNRAPVTTPKVVAVRLHPGQAAVVREYQALLEAVVRAVTAGGAAPPGAVFAGMQGDMLMLQVPSGE